MNRDHRYQNQMSKVKSLYCSSHSVCLERCNFIVCGGGLDDKKRYIAPFRDIFADVFYGFGRVEIFSIAMYLECLRNKFSFLLITHIHNNPAVVNQSILFCWSSVIYG